MDNGYPYFDNEYRNEYRNDLEYDLVNSGFANKSAKESYEKLWTEVSFI